VAIYTATLTAAASGSASETLEIEGDWISMVSIKFPPGPQGLMGVSIWYGIKQIFPTNEGAWFRSEDHTLQWDEYWEMPESPMTITIRAINDDDTYSHSVYVSIVTMTEEQSLTTRLARTITRSIRAASGLLGGD